MYGQLSKFHAETGYDPERMDLEIVSYTAAKIIK